MTTLANVTWSFRATALYAPGAKHILMTTPSMTTSPPSGLLYEMRSSETVDLDTVIVTRTFFFSAPSSTCGTVDVLVYFRGFTGMFDLQVHLPLRRVHGRESAALTPFEEPLFSQQGWTQDRCVEAAKEQQQLIRLRLH